VSVGFICSFVCPQSIFGTFQPIVTCYKMPFTKFYAYENCAVVGYYTARSGNLLQMFLDNLFVPSFLIYEDGTGWLSQNVGKKLPLVTG